MDIEEATCGDEDDMAREPKADPDELSVAERGKLRDRIIARMDALNVKIAQVVERSKISSAEVYKYRNATKKNPNIKQLRALARALECPVAYLLGLTDDVGQRKATTIPVTGAAEVGAYKSSPSEHLGEIQDIAPREQRYAASRRFGIILNDDSLEGLSPPASRGQVALVIEFDAATMEIESGKIYLIYRRIPTGQIETAFWRASVFRDRYEFASMSRDHRRNEHNKFSIPRQGFEDLSHVQIGGLFYGTSFQY